MSHVVIIMAAGDGVRMRSDVPKVLHPVAGRPILSWIVEAAAAGDPERMMVVVGSGAGRVKSMLPAGVKTCHQRERRGTGQAVSLAMEALGELSDSTPVVVLPGDVPLLTAEVIGEAIESHRARGGAATMLTAEAEDPRGYGRVLRDSGGRVQGVVEHVDATATQREIREINTSIYVFSAGPLRAGLGRIGVANQQREYYLPDVIGVMIGDGQEVAARLIPFHDSLGVNDQAQLAEAAAWMRRRILTRHMLAGVRVEDPERVYVEADVRLAAGVKLYAGVHLEGDVEVGEGAIIGPDAYIRDSRIGAGARVWYSVVRESEIGQSVEVGPYASLRPGALIEEGAKAGNFRRDQKHPAGEGRQGASPFLPGRCRCRGRRQHRGGDDHRQLRRVRQASHQHRGGGADRLQHGVGGAGGGGRGRMDRGRLDHNPTGGVRGAFGGAFPAEKHRRLCGATGSPLPSGKGKGSFAVGARRPGE